MTKRCENCKYLSIDESVGFCECVGVDNFTDEEYSIYEDKGYLDNCKHFKFDTSTLTSEELSAKECKECQFMTWTGGCSILNEMNIDAGYLEFDEEWHKAMKEHRRMKYCPLGENNDIS